MKECAPLVLGIIAALLFAWLPVLIYGYNYPPCQELADLDGSIRTCDPKGLDNLLDFRAQGYYGHLPAKILGMHFYYRLTPALIFVGLWILLRRYGWTTPVLAWVALFLISRAIAFDMRNGTFVGLINFYLWGFILIHYTSRWVNGESRWVFPALMAALMAAWMVFFHAFTGLVAFAGAILHWGAYRKPPFAFVMALLGVSVFISVTMLPSSISRLEKFPSMAKALISSGPRAVLREAVQVREPERSKNQAIIGGEAVGEDYLAGMFVEYPRMSLARFGKEYLGEGVLIFWLLADIVAYFAYKQGWRPKRDTVIVMLALTIVPLAFMTFSPFALNADRTAKLLIGITMVLASVTVVKGLQYLGDRRLYGAAGVLGALALVYEVPQLIPYWFAMGSYE